MTKRKTPDPFDVDGFISEVTDSLAQKQAAERPPGGSGLASHLIHTEIKRVSTEQAARERRDRINGKKLKLNE